MSPKAKRSPKKSRGGQLNRSATEGRHSLRHLAGVVFLAASFLASFLLVLEHFGGLSLPGCGDGGACEQAAKSVWGKIQLGDFVWPVSFVGLTYFFSLFVVWIGSRGRLPAMIRNLARFGVLVSLFFIVIIGVEKTFCPYCIATHLGNVAFWIMMETTRAKPRRTNPLLIGFVASFVLATGTLGILVAQHGAAIRERAEGERSAAAQQIIREAREDSSAPAVSEEEEVESAAAESGAEEPIPDRPAQTAPPIADGGEFTGRYIIGPRVSPIRIVMFTDYQCQDCYRIEKELKQLHATRSDISISIKHFPFNSDCNPHISRTIHPNACWAARAAEAAGILWGPEGFWKMHTWLFDKRGVFQRVEELEAAIRGMGYDPSGFRQVLMSEATREGIEADTEEAYRLGLHFTPMIFINGVELKGWSSPNALIRTVEEVAATHPAARSPADDHPPVALEKYVADWRDQPVLELPPDPTTRAMGSETPRISIVVWGDYQESATAMADQLIRRFASEREDVRYAFRHFPFSQECNPEVTETRHADACRTALAAEATARLLGNEGFWKMHSWLIENQDLFSEETLRQKVSDLGMEINRFETEANGSEARSNILEDARAGKQLPSLRHGMPPGIYTLPTIFINGRFVPRWQLDGKVVLREILDEAARGR